MIQAPPSWKVHLVDNAGFGEAGQEGIIKQATTALVTSSAYVYIMSYENLGDSKDVAAFQRIYDKDRGQTEILCTTLHFTLLPQLPFFFMHVNSWEEDIISNRFQSVAHMEKFLCRFGNCVDKV